MIFGKKEKRPGQQIYSTLCVVRQSPWLAGLQSSFITWTLLRSSFTGCNPELAILSSLQLLHCINCSFGGDLYLSRVQYRVCQVDRILLVQGFGDGTSTKRLSSHQRGNKKFHSTESLNIYLTDQILKAMDNKKITALVLLDLSKAFDSINHDRLLDKLAAVGASPATVQ